MKKYELSIVILNWNTEEVTKNCLESLAKARIKNTEIILVDNASQDYSLKTFYALKKKHPELNLQTIENKKNYGFAKGNNIGAEKAKGKYLLLLNSDTIVDKGSIEILLDFLKTNKDVAAVSPMLMNPDGSKQIEYYFKFPNLFFSFYHNIVLRPLLTKTFLKNLIISQPKNVPFEVDQLPGAAILTSKATYEITNGLDEDYKFLFEDVDWCLKVKKKKLGKLMVIPSSKIIHLGGASWKKWKENDSYAFYKQYFLSFFTFVKKHQRSKTLLYKILLTDSFADNIFIHLIRGKIEKAKVQLKLIFFIWN